MEEFGDPISAREVVVREFNSLRGRLLTIIESANLPQKQEKALTTLIKNVSFQNQAAIVDLVEQLDDERLFQYVPRKVQLL